MAGTTVDEPSFNVDYDVSRWLRVPRDPATVDVRRWARQAAEAWARDTGHEGNRRWRKLFAQHLEVAAAMRFTDEPDCVFLHVLAPPDGPPSPLVVTLRFLPSDADTDLDSWGRVVAETFAEGAVEPPTDEAVTLASGGPARVVVTHQREDDGALVTNLNVVWLPDPLLLAVVGTGAAEVGRVVVSRDDMVALAGATRVLRPGDEMPGEELPQR